jgi:release factor glutamine methyltransferase
MPRSVHDRIAEARHALTRAGLAPEDAALDAEVLARHALGWDLATLLTRGLETPPPEFEARYSNMIARRVTREPVAHIVGYREFWGLDFEVTPDVLIPRPETELIIEEALADSGERTRIARIVDVGTGSGCLAVSLAREFPDAHVIATDISEAALKVASRNAAKHGVDARVRFVRTSFLDGLRGAADLIVSNPPYVPTGAAGSLPPEVARFEPDAALFAGVDGMRALRRLMADTPRVLADNGLLVVEFGFGQQPDVRRDAQRAGWRVVRIRPDLQGIPRVAVLRR